MPAVNDNFGGCSLSKFIDESTTFHNSKHVLNVIGIWRELSSALTMTLFWKYRKGCNNLMQGAHFSILVLRRKGAGLTSSDGHLSLLGGRLWGG